MIPKPRRIVDKKAIEAARKPWCEYCGDTYHIEVHHIKSKGSGGNDEANNLVSLCACHHRMVHDGLIRREELRAIVARRHDNLSRIATADTVSG
jgi:predicted restriction endonuclease